MNGSDLESLMFEHHIRTRFPCGRSVMPEDVGGHCGPAEHGGDCPLWGKNEAKNAALAEYCDKTKVNLETLLRKLEAAKG